MKKGICLLCICLCTGLCACQGAFSEKEYIFKETRQSAAQEETSDPEMEFLEKYNDVFAEEGAKRAALIYLDGDSVPELLILKDGEYKLYSYDGTEAAEICMPNEEIRANAYGPRHYFEESVQQTFYWFEYVPYEGLVRVHGGTENERSDHYLRYADGLFKPELEAKSMDCIWSWYTYGEEGEIANEEFISHIADLGYDGLIPCEYLYEEVETAYENIGRTSDTQKVLEDFVNGKTNALDHVEEITDIPEDGFVMKNYEFYYCDAKVDEEGWAEAEYIDFDNDGKDELIIHGYAGTRYFFDVIGGTVYRVLHTGSTTDTASVAEIDGTRVIERTDLLHAGRKHYRIMTYDRCCCLTDCFRIYTEYEGQEYSENDLFEYREREISMEEFETILDSIHEP